jgi:hypothetical protein
MPGGKKPITVKIEDGTAFNFDLPDVLNRIKNGNNFEVGESVKGRLLLLATELE